jgi:hypothetical protein
VKDITSSLAKALPGVLSRNMPPNPVKKPQMVTE